MHILFHRPTPWSSSVQCSTKTLAMVAAAQGHHVTYLQSSINLAHWLTRRGYYRTWREGPRKVNDRIYVTSGLSLVPDMTWCGIYSNWLASVNYRTSFPGIRRQVERAGFGPPDVVWSTVPGSAVLKKIFPTSKFAFHVIDLYSAFRGSAIRKFEIHDYQTADRVFCIGHSLERFVVDNLGISQSKTSVLGQGVHLDNYRSVQQEPQELQGLPHPRALWVGVLDKLDESLLASVADELDSRGGSLVLIGPTGNRSKEFLESNDAFKKNHVHILGARDTQSVPAYMQHCDIGLMLYDQSKKEVYQGQNPLKLYEYLAAGLPVISTPHDEFEYISPPISIVERNEELHDALEDSLNQTDAELTAREEFVESRSWQRIFERALQELESLPT